MTWQEQDGTSGCGHQDQIFVSRASSSRGRQPVHGLRPRGATRERCSAGSRSASTAWTPTAALRRPVTRRSTSTPAATGSSPTSRSPAPTTRSRGSSGTRPTPARSVCATTSRCSRPRRQRQRRRRRLPWQAVGRARPARSTCSTGRAPGLRPVRRVDQRRGCVFVNAIPQQGCRRSARRDRHPDPGHPDGALGVWAEDIGNGRHGIFVGPGWSAAIISSCSTAAAPVSDIHRDSVRPDITFFGNVPYMSWIEPHGKRQPRIRRTFRERRVPSWTHPEGSGFASRLRSAPVIDARVPLSSSCTSDPFTNDGACVPAGSDQRPVLPVHDRYQPSAAVWSGRDRGPELRAVPRLQARRRPPGGHRGALEHPWSGQRRRHPRAADRRNPPRARQAGVQDAGPWDASRWVITHAAH